MKLRLRHIATGDFRRTEVTNFETHFGKLVKQGEFFLGSNEAVAFVNKAGTQIVFVYRTVAMEGKKGQPCRVVPSQRLRIQGGSFEPRMLANYAAEVGLELEGIRRYEEYYAKLADAR